MSTLFSKFRFRNIKPARIIFYSFLIAILTGALLLVMPFSSSTGKSIGFLDALFTATSAVCVTGLVVVDTAIAFSPFGQTVILILIQIGGLGLMAFATLFALILGRKVNLKERLTIQESLNEFNLSGVVRLFKYILIATFSLELLGAAVLSFRFIPQYGIGRGLAKSIFHSVSAFCNAGFDILSTSEAPFSSLTSYSQDPLVILTIASLFIIGGLGFITWRDIFTVRKFKEYMLHTKVVLLTTGFLLVSGLMLFFIFEYNTTLKDMNIWDKLMNAFFHAATPRTAGFNSLPVDQFLPQTKFITILLMFIGGASGSTAGGIKVTTTAIILFTLFTYLKGRDDVNILQRKINPGIIKKAMSILFLAFTLVLVTTFVLLMSGDGDLTQCLFEAVSAFGTVGLSTGITPYLSIVGKIAIIITMFLGRLGPLALAISITFLASSNKPYSYPEGKISVG
jgi:trk system potassium uptake protein